MNELTPKERKILNFISKHPNCTYTTVFRKYPAFADYYPKFLYLNLIKSDDPDDSVMGNEYDNMSNPTVITIADNGIIYLESKKWFNLQYVLTSIIVPIVIGVLTAIITIVLSNVL